jgi:hypothetical protein
MFCQLSQLVDLIYESIKPLSSENGFLLRKVTILATTSEKISKDLLESRGQVVV